MFLHEHLEDLLNERDYKLKGTERTLMKALTNAGLKVSVTTRQRGRDSEESLVADKPIENPSILYNALKKSGVKNPIVMYSTVGFTGKQANQDYQFRFAGNTFEVYRGKTIYFIGRGDKLSGKLSLYDPNA